MLDDCLYNIINDTVLRAHREEKMARMQSAAIVAVGAREKSKAEAAPGEETGPITTAGATITEDNKIILHGNPLSTTTETICLTCRLPRLNYPTTGKNAQIPDPSKKYCTRHPYIEKDGYDIYGKPLAVERPSKKKAAAKQKANDSRSGSESGNNSPSGKKEKGTAMPSAKCPTCPRYLYFNRIAHHLERCAGIAGRQSSRNALAKLNSNTPKESSRASTPKPSSQPPSQTKANSSQGSNNKKRKKGSDDEEEETEKITAKKKKTGTGKKEGKGKVVNHDVARVKGAEKRLPGQSDSLKAGTPDKDVKGED